MARYKQYSYEQGIMIPVDFTKQVVPGTLEYTIHWLVDNKVDLTGISGRFKNESTGAPAYDPAILLKVVLLAYSRGIISSRKIMDACRENIVFRANCQHRLEFAAFHRFNFAGLFKKSIQADHSGFKPVLYSIRITFMNSVQGNDKAGFIIFACR